MQSTRFKSPNVFSTSCTARKKDGQSVLNVLEKQWETVGMNRYDFFSGSGDGGGENEGAGGIHATMEDVSHSYVRRRCLGHWGWRNAGAAMSEDEKLVSEVQDANGLQMSQPRHLSSVAHRSSSSSSSSS
eukprot:4097993-Pyramimonas_sp.AAC.1